MPTTKHAPNPLFLWLKLTRHDMIHKWKVKPGNLVKKNDSEWLMTICVAVNPHVFSIPSVSNCSFFLVCVCVQNVITKMCMSFHT